MKLRKSAGGLVSDFYDHWTRFNIRYALSVATYRFKKWGDPSFRYVRSHSLWVSLPNCWQANPARFVLCCFHGWFSRFLADGLGFYSYVTKHFDHSQIIFKLAENLFDHIESQKQHSLGANTSWSQLQLGNPELKKSHGHIICSHELPSVWIPARTP